MIRRLLPILLFGCPLLPAQGVPTSLLGRWRIDRVVAATPHPCWDGERAATLVGSSLSYGPDRMRWQGGEVPLQGMLASTRTLTRRSFAEEYGLSLDALGIRAPAVTEIDLQHEDADITGATTEVPGDTVLAAGPGRIVVSACGVFYVAVRARR